MLVSFLAALFSIQVALEVAMRHHGARALGGCVAVSAALAEGEPVASPPSPAPGPHTPVLITRGEADDVITADDVVATVGRLRAVAPSCGAHVVSVSGKGHAMPGNAVEMRAIMEFWAHTLRHTPVGAHAEGGTLVELR